MTYGVTRPYAAAAGEACKKKNAMSCGLPAGLKGHAAAAARLGDGPEEPRGADAAARSWRRCWTSSQFAVFPFLGPLLKDLAMAPPSATAAFFAVIGVAGFVGNVMRDAHRRGGSAPTHLADLRVVRSSSASLIWAPRRGTLALMGCGALFFGLGFAALNSMQQARLSQPYPRLRVRRSRSTPRRSMSDRLSAQALPDALLTHGRLFEIGYGSLVFIACAVGRGSDDDGRGRCSSWEVRIKSSPATRASRAGAKRPCRARNR